jgi:hypothetical protein
MTGKTIWIRASDVCTLRRYGIEGTQIETDCHGLIEVMEQPEEIIKDIRIAESD